MRIVDSSGREVNTGDIVWGERCAYIFLQSDGERIEVKTVDDRRMFVWLYPQQLKLTIEANQNENCS